MDEEKVILRVEEIRKNVKIAKLTGMSIVFLVIFFFLFIIHTELLLLSQWHWFLFLL